MVKPASRSRTDPLELREGFLCSLQGRGLEIGALCNPTRHPSSARVFYADIQPNPVLRARYPELKHRPFVPLHFLTDGHRLACKPRSLDFIIANHVLEHLPNPIQGLLDWHAALKDKGSLLLTVPDPRRTVDRARPKTTLNHLISDFRQGASLENLKRELKHYRSWAAEAMNLRGKASQQTAEKLLEEGYPIHFHLFSIPGGILMLLRHLSAHHKAHFKVADYLYCLAYTEGIFLLQKKAHPVKLPLTLPQRLFSTQELLERIVLMRRRTQTS